MAARSLVLGTHNEKKKRELRILREPVGIKLRTLKAFPAAIEVEETGDTFQANAQLKATEQARILNQWVLGEDSGLVVEALNGAPGVYSARFAGEPRDDERNNDKLLAELSGVPQERRGAYYVCHMSLARPDGKIVIDCEAYCRGRIIMERQGQAGFGYDPMFELPEYHQTFGQLGDSVKSVLSHRARATRTFVDQLQRLIARGEWQ